MSLVGFKGQNHEQQVLVRGPRKEVDDRGTMPEVFDPISERFGGFTVDVAAAAHNAKVERFYTIDDDGLAQSWSGEKVWCNPPYSNIEPWLEKAWFEFERPDYGAGKPAELIVMLLPANRTEQGWWQRHVEPRRDRGETRGLRVEFLSGRLRFIKPGQKHVGPNERPPFGCCLLIWSER